MLSREVIDRSTGPHGPARGPLHTSVPGTRRLLVGLGLGVLPTATALGLLDQPGQGWAATLAVGLIWRTGLIVRRILPHLTGADMRAKLVTLVLRLLEPVRTQAIAGADRHHDRGELDSKHPPSRGSRVTLVIGSPFCRNCRAGMAWPDVVAIIPATWTQLPQPDERSTQSTLRWGRDLSSLGSDVPPVPGWSELTASELSVARLASAALTNRQIARRIGRSVHTVNYHLRNIFKKLGIQSRVQLAAMMRPAGEGAVQDF